MSKTVVEQVWGELTEADEITYNVQADAKTYNVQLDLTIKKLMVDELTMPVGRVIEEEALSPMSGVVVPDGSYVLAYVFDGKLQKKNVRVVGGTLLSA